MWRRVLVLSLFAVLAAPTLLGDSAPSAKGSPYSAPANVFPVLRAPVQQGDRCEAPTHHCISDDFYPYWVQNGGLAVFGWPINDAGPLVNPTDGKTYTQQWFERERLELHPENTPPYDVLLGLLGTERLAIRDAELRRSASGYPLGSSSAPNYFAQTGHSVANIFADFWSVRGLNLDDSSAKSIDERVALFGYPITEVKAERLPTGPNQSRTFQTQWFQRARFESHPENPVGNRIQLGLLGYESNSNNDDVPRVAFDDFRHSGGPFSSQLGDRLQALQPSVPPLEYATELNAAAQNHANYYLSNYQLFSGSKPQLGPTQEASGRPNFTGETPDDRAQAMGFQFIAGDEIIAFTDKAQVAVNFWLKDKSPEAEAARNVILNPDNVFMGQGYGSIVLPTRRTVSIYVIDFGTHLNTERPPTDTPTSTGTPTRRPTITFTPSPTHTFTPTLTFTPTFTSTDTPTITPIITDTETPTIVPIP